MSPDDRRPPRGAPFERGRFDRNAPGQDRGERPQQFDRPGFGGPRPFVRPPTRGGDMPPPEHVVRLRDGEREVEVHGNPAFVRQVLDDLPTLMARLRGDAPARTSISMPAPPAEGVAEAPDAAVAPAARADDGARNGHADHVDGNGAATPSAGSLEERVFDVLRGSTRPLAVAAIRQRLDSAELTGQQVRRVLERAGGRVVVSSDRPATYSLR